MNCESTGLHPEWSYQAVLYEMNVRQLTPEGTLRAALAAGITVQANAPTPVAPSMAKAIDIYLQKVHKGEEIEPVELVTDTEKEEFIRSQQHKLAKKSRTRRTAEPRK